MRRRRNGNPMSDTLDNELSKLHMDNISNFLEENKDEILDDEFAFSKFMRSKFKEKGILQQDVFLYADIPERYGYKLISQEKRTKQRDIILRICYSARFSIEETQRALRLYRMPELYIEFPRDAIIMVIIKDRPGDIIEVNSILRGRGMMPLRSSGAMD